MNLVWIQYSLVNIVWNTASTGSYGGTVFPEGVRYSLVNNVCGVRYALGYRIHSDTGADVRRCAAALRSTAAAFALLRSLSLYCCRFRSTAAALRTTAAALRSGRSALMGHHNNRPPLARYVQ